MQTENQPTDLWPSHPIALCLLECTFLKIALRDPLFCPKPMNIITGKIEFFAFHEKYIFIKLEYKDHLPLTQRIFWCTWPMVQKNYQIGSEVKILYDSVKFIDFEIPPELFFIHSIKILRDNSHAY
mgnify:CR=1 FL=1